MLTNSENLPGRGESVVYDLFLIVCGMWLVGSGASWLAFAVFVIACLGALGVFSNRLWRRKRYMLRPLDSALAFAINLTLLGIPALMILNDDGRARCLVALGIWVGTRLVMRPPPSSPLLKRRRRSKKEPSPPA